MKKIRRCLSVVAALGGVLLTLGGAAPSALASLAPPDPGEGGIAPIPAVGGGTPGWQIALIAAGAAVVAAVIAVLADRARAARHITAARPDGP